MKKILSILSLIVPSMLVMAGDTTPADTDLKKETAEWMRQQPVRFLENNGQMTDMDGKPVPFVLFKAEVPGMNMYITEQGITYTFIQGEEEKEKGEYAKGKEERKNEEKRLPGREEEGIFKWARVDMELKGATIKKENMVKEGASREHFNYFYGHCPDGIYGVKEYEKITIKNIYPNIDWVLYNSHEKGFKYDFVVHAGADYKTIEMLWHSRLPLALKEDGSIEGATAYGTLQEQAPKSFYQKKTIPTLFEKNYQKQISINGEEGYETSIAFSLPPLPSGGAGGRLLIIDPTLSWATFYGGNGVEGPMSIDTDNSNNVFVTGYTSSVNFPVQDTGTFFQGTYAGGTYDVFILKFDNAGTRLWATYYGGSGLDAGISIVLDDSGNVFVTGLTASIDFPVQDAGTFFQGTYAGGTYDVFILKFDKLGNRLWATYYGGSGEDGGTSIALDNSGNVFVTGETASTDFPVQNAFQGTYADSSDVFILKFDNAGKRLWATYYGGSGEDGGTSIALDNSGNVFVTGVTYSTDFPVQDAATFFQGTYAGAGDAFILKFDTAGKRLWATYYGGSGEDVGTAIVLDDSGNVFVTGGTYSTDFPVQDAATFFQGTYAGAGNTFILKFDNAGKRLWATYFGESRNSKSTQITDNLSITSCGNVYMSFITGSRSLPFQPSCDAAYYDITHNGGLIDIFLVLFSNTGMLLWSTYIGGAGIDFRAALALDVNDNLFMTGEWTSAYNSSSYPVNYPGGSAYYDDIFNGGYEDGYMIKFLNAPCMCSYFITSTPVLCKDECNGTAAVGVIDATSTYTYNWSNGQTTGAITGLCAGTYSVLLTDAFSITTTAIVTITQPTVFTGSVSSTNTRCEPGTGTATIAVKGGTAPYTYSWSNGATASPISNLAAQIYTVTATDANGCVITQTVSVSQPANPTATATATSTTITVGSSTTLSATGIGTYNWTPAAGLSCTSCANPSATPNETTTYCVMVSDTNGCTDSVCITITVSPCGEVFVPTAFSPNNDGYNELECALGSSCVKSFRFAIFDRWGNKVFETDKPEICWDGTFKGKAMNAAVFVYFLNAVLTNGDAINQKGNISLVR